MMDIYLRHLSLTTSRYTSLYLRIALAAAFLTSVTDRFGIWGRPGTMNVAWGDMAHFMAGFVSQTYPDQAYIHFVGIEPNYRGRGLGRQLYSTFFETVRRLGCTTVRCITSPVNGGSIAFHTRMGFCIERSNGERHGVPCMINYEPKGADRVLFVRSLL